MTFALCATLPILALLKEECSGRDFLRHEVKSKSGKISRREAAERKRFGADTAKIKSSEVVWGPFVSASSSRLTLARPASLLPLRAAARDLRLGSGLTANRINLPYASELYLAFNISSRSPRPALCYRPLLTLLPNLAIRKVIPLEPRTPHQPEKL
jgi:hypothetical protein